MIPAKSHPEVVVQAIASRDRKKGEAFAKKHGIPEVKDSYQGGFALARQVSQSIASLTLINTVARNH